MLIHLFLNHKCHYDLCEFEESKKTGIICEICDLYENEKNVTEGPINIRIVYKCM